MSTRTRPRGGSLGRRTQLSLLPLFLLLIAPSCAPDVDPPQGGNPGVITFEAFGTATANGQKAPGEWDTADCTQFLVRLPGGGTETAEICMMNDGQNLYSMVSYPRTVVDSFLLFGMDFDTPSTPTAGSQRVDHYLTQGGVPFTDAYPVSNVTQPDVTDGGTQDGAGGLDTAGGMHVYELAHPLNSTDDSHDFSLQAGDLIDFCAAVGVGSEMTQFPGLCEGPTTTHNYVGRVKIAQAPIDGTRYTPSFEGRICAVVPGACPERQPLPHPCAEKPALCEKPRFQESGMFLYCAVKPCAVHDELPRNCLVKYPCPEPPVGPPPPFYHLTFTGLNDDWDVVLVDREGGKVPHRVIPIEGGVVLSFQPDKEKHMPGLIGDYVAMFVMRDSGRAGVRYEVGARLNTADRHYEPQRRR